MRRTPTGMINPVLSTEYCSTQAWITPVLCPKYCGTPPKVLRYSCGSTATRVECSKSYSARSVGMVMLYSRILYDSFMNVSVHKGEILFWVDLNCLSCLKTFIRVSSLLYPKWNCSWFTLTTCLQKIHWPARAYSATITYMNFRIRIFNFFTLNCTPYLFNHNCL